MKSIVASSDERKVTHVVREIAPLNLHDYRRPIESSSFSAKRKAQFRPITFCRTGIRFAAFNDDWVML
jgi:hypothetical protein